MTLSLHYWRPLLMVALTAMMATATGPVTSATSASLMTPLSIPKTGASMFRSVSTAFVAPNMKPPRSVSLRIAQLRSLMVVCQATKVDDATVATNESNSPPSRAIHPVGEKDGLPVYRGNWGPEYPELNEADPDAPAGSPASRPYMAVQTGWLNALRIVKTSRDSRKLIGYLNGLPLYVDAEIPEPQSALVSVGDGPAMSHASASNQPDGATDNTDLAEGTIELIGEQDGVPVYRANLGPESAGKQRGDPAESRDSAAFKLVVTGYLRGRPVYQIARVWRQLIGYMNDLPLYDDIEISKFQSSAFVSADAHQVGPAEPPASAYNVLPLLFGHRNGVPVYLVHCGAEPHSDVVSAEYHHDPELNFQGYGNDGLPSYRATKYPRALVSEEPLWHAPAETPACCSHEHEGNTSDDAECSCQQLVETTQEEPPKCT